MKLHLLLVQVQTWDRGQVERLGRHKLVIAPRATVIRVPLREK